MIRVLLVDDSAVFRRGLRALLEADGRFQVVAEAGDGRPAASMCSISGAIERRCSIAAELT